MKKHFSVKGIVELPGDKSIAHRAAIFTALSGDKSVITNHPDGHDFWSTVSILKALGADIQSLSPGTLSIKGPLNNNIKENSRLELNAGNSGTTMRLMAGLVAGLNTAVKISGDESLSLRPMERIRTPLAEMGADIQLSPKGTAPIINRNHSGLRSIQFTLPVASAQVKSAIILAALFAKGESKINDPFGTRDHTERMLGLKSEKGIIRVPENILWPSGEIYIPGDISSAAFFVVLALCTPGADLTIKNVSLNPGRIGYINLLQQFGADITIEETGESLHEPFGILRVKHSRIQGGQINKNVIPGLIDEIPVLSILALHTDSGIKFEGIEELKFKESNRITAIIDNLRTFGAETEEWQDGLFVSPLKSSEFIPAEIKSFDDHRIAMSMYICGLTYGRHLTIDNPHCVEISFPGFFQSLSEVAV